MAIVDVNPVLIILSYNILKYEINITCVFIVTIAIEAITSDGLGEEVNDEFESTEERTHFKTQEVKQAASGLDG